MWKQKQIHNDEQSIESFVGMPWSKVTECQRKHKRNTFDTVKRTQ